MKSNDKKIPIAEITVAVILVVAMISLRIWSIQKKYALKEEERQQKNEHAQVIENQKQPLYSELDRLTSQLQEFPGDDRLRRARVDIYLRKGHFRDAMGDLNVIISHKKEEMEPALEFRGQLYMSKTNWQAALASLNEAAKTSGYSPVKHVANEMCIGQCQFFLGNYENAVAHFSAALKAPGLTPEQASKLHHDRSVCYKKLGKTDLAQKDHDLIKVGVKPIDWLPNL